MQEKMIGVINLSVFPKDESTKRFVNGMELYDVPESVEVLSTVGNKLSWQPVQTYSVHEKCNVYQIKFSNGSNIHSTKDASVVTLDKNLDFERAIPKVGLTVAKVTKVPTPPADSIIDTLVMPVPKTRMQYLFNDIPLDRTFGIFVGLFIGDGYIYKERCIVAKADNAVKDFLGTTINSYRKSDKPIPIHTEYKVGKIGGKEYDYQIHQFRSNVIAPVLKNLIGHKAKGKRLPEFWFHTSEEFRWGLLSGLISSDGGIHKNKITISTASVQLAYEIVALAGTLGLKCNNSIHKKKGKDSVSYNLGFYESSNPRIKENVTIISDYKKELVANLPDESKTRVTCPPVPEFRLAQLRKFVENNVEGRDSRKKCFSALNNGLTLTSAKEIAEVEGIRECLEKDPFWVKWLDWLYNPDIEWLHITSMELVLENVKAYDLTIDPQYTMVGENMLIHGDTMTCHVVASEEAIQEAYQMMPSKNLFNPRDSKVMIKPDQEAVMGMYLMTKGNDKSIKTFKTVADAKAAYAKGLIDVDDKIKIIKPI